MAIPTKRGTLEILGGGGKVKLALSFHRTQSGQTEAEERAAQEAWGLACRNSGERFVVSDPEEDRIIYEVQIYEYDYRS